MVAVVGIDDRRQGHVRRGFFGSSDCTDYALGPVCWTLNRTEASIVNGCLYDAGLAAGTHGRGLQLRDPGRGPASCAIEPFPRAIATP